MIQDRNPKELTIELNRVIFKEIGVLEGALAQDVNMPR